MNGDPGRADTSQGDRPTTDDRESGEIVEGELVEPGEEPDVFLDVPTLKVDEIDLDVQDLRARVALRAEVLELLKLNIGVDLALGSVKLDIKGVEAQALLKVRLDNVARILDSVLRTIDRNPQILEQITSSVGSAVEDVGDSAGKAVGELGRGAGEAVQDVGEGAGDAVGDVGEGAGQAAGDVGKGAGQAADKAGEGAAKTAGDVGGDAKDAGEETAEIVEDSDTEDDADAEDEAPGHGSRTPRRHPRHRGRPSKSGRGKGAFAARKAALSRS